MRTFKFFAKLKDYTINIQDVPMFKVYTYGEVTQKLIDEMQNLVSPYILLPNTEDNRKEMMDALSPYFFKIESIYEENQTI
jgi:hypothetical protein